MNNNSCKKNKMEPTQHNMQTFHCASAVGEAYTEDFLKVGSSCEGITIGHFTTFEPKQKYLSLATEYIKKNKNKNIPEIISPLLGINLNNFITNENYKEFMKLNNFDVNDEKLCNIRNKLKCYKLNSLENENKNDDCNVSMDKLNREMFLNYTNNDNPFSNNTHINPTAIASDLYTN